MINLWHLLLKVKMAKNHHFTHSNLQVQNDFKSGFLRSVKWFMNFTPGDFKYSNLGSEVTNLFPCARFHNDVFLATAEAIL